MRYRAWMLLALLGVGALSAWWLIRGRDAGRATGSLRREVYVWQRAWSQDVRTAVREHGQAFARVVVLGAQITWEKAPDGKVTAKIFRVPVAWPELKALGKQVGVAVRIGGYIRGEAYQGAAADAVENAVRGVCASARDAGLNVNEVQLDFDAAESKLDGYRQWVKAAKRGSGGVAVRITALPSWLERQAFVELAQECGGYVLQVHSLERPKRMDEEVALCDAAKARAAVEKAGKIGVPFRVALPTYGYLLVFDAAGKFAGLEAEGTAAAWPEGCRKKWLGADAAELAGLVAGWEKNRVKGMEGVIWYRLPVASDRHNWRWPTLAAVMQGRRPEAKVLIECIKAQEAGVRDVVVSNIGEDDGRGTMQVDVSWNAGTMVASDVIGGFERCCGGARLMRIRGLMDPDERLAPGETRKIAWLRLEPATATESQVNAVAR